MPAALPPIKPRSSGGNRPSPPGGKRPNSKSASPRAPAGPPPIPTLTPAQATAINNDEETQRTAIRDKEMLEYIHLAAWRNDEALLGVQLQTEKTTKVLSKLSDVTAVQATTNDETKSQMNGLTEASNALHSDLKNFIAWHSSTSTDRLKALEKEAFHLQRTVEVLTEENGKLKSENVGLRQTLTRKVVGCDNEMTLLRERVHKQMEDDRLDFAHLKSGVFQRIDAAVLQYHRPQFESAVQGLREHLASVEAEVQAHTQRLQQIADGIGGSGIMAEVKSMHSQLPERLRSDLRLFTKEQLLSLVDVLSFEPGVTTAVAAAVATSNVHNTQSVF